MLVHLTHKSTNAKTGPIPVSTSDSRTCPEACPLKRSGCYADVGPLRLHWDSVSNGNRGVDWHTFTSLIQKLPPNQLWRHNQAGDLPGIGNTIDAVKMTELVAANLGKRGFTYTHKPPSAANLEIIRRANNNGFVVNISANNPSHADKLFGNGAPVVTLLPGDAVSKRHTYTPKGRKIVVCPATRSDTINCSKCALCQKADRNFIIGFPAHGTSSTKANTIASL